MFLNIYYFLRKRLWRYIIYFFSFVLIVFSVAELYCRSFLPDFNDKSYTTASFGIPTAFKPNLNINLSFSEFPFQIKTDERGLRNFRKISIKKPSNTFRILCVGGSIFAASGVNNEETFAFYLDKLLNQNISKINFEGINAGKNFWELAEFFTFFQNEGYKYSPDLTIAYFHTGELSTMDFSEILAESISYERYSDNKVVIEIRGIEFTENLNKNFEQILKLVQLIPFNNLLYKNLKAWRVLESFLIKNLVLEGKDRQNSDLKNLGLEMQSWDLKDGDFIDWKTDYGEIKNSPVGQRKTVIYSIGLEKFYDLVESRGSKLLFLSIPSPNEILGFESYSKELKPFMIKRHEGFYWLDLLKPLKEIQFSNLVPLNFPEVIHWTPAGHFSAAVLAADKLIESEVISSKEDTFKLSMKKMSQSLKIANERISLKIEKLGFDAFIKGIIYLNNKRFNDAEKYLKIALEKTSKDWNIFWQLGRLHFLKKNFKKAIFFTKQSLENGMMVNDAAYVLMAKSYFNLNQFEESEIFFRKALKISPTNYGNHLFLAQMLFFTERFDESLKEFKIANRLFPNNIKILSGLGGAYLRTGQKERAVQTFDTIIKIEPENLLPEIPLTI
jgi:tetratricopeptide (TPR) repeat protein